MAQGRQRAKRIAERLRVRVAQIRKATHVSVVMLGPGGSGFDGQKRRRVSDHLSKSHSNAEVVLPEDVVDAELRTLVGTGRAEAELVQMSDLVIALIPPAARVSGVFTELIEFVRIEGFTDKLHVFRPDTRLGKTDEWGYPERRMYELVDTSRFHDYPDDWWPDCTDLRAMASQLLENERNRKIALAIPPSQR